MQRKKDDIKVANGRVANIKSYLSKEIDLSRFDISETIKDYKRARGLVIYFNGKRAFPDSAIRNETTIPKALDRHLIGVNPIIINYIKNYGHQNGYLNISESTTKPMLVEKGKIFDSDHCRYEYITNRDGSVTFVESFSIEKFIDITKRETPVVQLEDGSPIATIVTKSTIRVVDGKILHTLDSDVISLHDELGESLFDDNDGRIEYLYTLRTNIRPLLDVISKLNLECDSFKEQLIEKMQSLFLASGFADEDRPGVVRSMIQDYLDKPAAGSKISEFSDKNAEFNLLAQQYRSVASSQGAIKQDRNDPHKREKDLREKISNFQNILFTEENRNIFKKSEDGLGLIFLKVIADILTLGRLHKKLFKPTVQTVFSRNIDSVAAPKSHEPPAKKPKR